MTDSQDSSIARAEEVLKGLMLDINHYRRVLLLMTDAKESGLATAHGSRS